MVPLRTVLELLLKYFSRKPTRVPQGLGAGESPRI